MSDMLWLQQFVDARIAASHKETAAAPNTVHLGVVVDRFGHVINAVSAALTIDAIYTMSATNTVLGDTTPKRLNFNSQEYDPLGQVTTGASWAFTAAAAGVYLVFVNAPLSVDLGDTWLPAHRADLTIQGAVNKSICTWTGIEVIGQPANLLLDGFRGIPLDAGDVIYAQLVQDSGTSYNVDGAIACIVIGHV